jgi:UDP:flavonoid glycosyltransferase YjiC (YdhE family)
VTTYWLALDQGIVMAALGNELAGDRLQRYLTRGAVEWAVRPLLAMEEFTAGG